MDALLPSSAAPSALDPASGPAWLRDPGLIRITVLIWAVVLLVIGTLVALQPDKRTVTPEYRGAALAWRAGADLYRVGPTGYLYPPQSAILFTPFTLPPRPVGEVLWRTFSLLLLATAVWRFAHLAAGAAAPGVFLLVTLLALPAGTGALRNGQMNIPLAGLMLHAAVGLASQRWNRAALVLTLAVALKPTALVFYGVAGVLFFRPMGWRLALGLLVVAALPFLLAAPDYALRQYDLAFQTMHVASTPLEEGKHGNLKGMLLAFGADPSPALMTTLRVTAGLATLALGALALRRHPRPAAVVLLVALTMSYLLLFNPRTENNTYIFVAPSVALTAVALGLFERRPAPALLLLLLCIALGFSAVLAGGTNRWVRPSATLIFAGLVIWQILRVPRPPSCDRHAAECQCSGKLDPQP